MKKTILFAFLLLAADSWAGSNPNRADMDINGALGFSVSQVGNKVTGRTSYGRSGIVNLTIENGRYWGFAGGSASTDIQCQKETCEGIIDGVRASFTSKTTVKKGLPVRKVEGQINFRKFYITRTAKEWALTGYNSIVLNPTKKNGSYSGSEYLFGPHPKIVYLDTSGSLKGLEDDALLTILAMPRLVGPSRGRF